MDNNDQHFFDNPLNVKRLLRALYVVCAILFALDFVIHRHTKHDWESLWGFYPIYGFVACVLLVMIAKWLRTFLMRPQDYYDKEELKDVEGDDNVDG